LRSDNGGGFTSKKFIDFCRKHGIKRQFSEARTPQQNGVVKRKNKIVHEMERTMLMDSKLKDIFQVQTMHTIVHIQNIGILRNKSNKTPYETMERKTNKCESF
jgi:transposase InsO family protein